MRKQSANVLQVRYIRRSWLAIGYLMVLLLVWGSLDADPVPGLDISRFDKAAHAFAYGFLLIWFGQAYKRKSARCRILVALMALGSVLEIAQGAGGYRFFELADLFAAGVGLLLGLTALGIGGDRILDRLEDCAGSRPVGRRPVDAGGSIRCGVPRATSHQPVPSQQGR